MTVKEEIAVYKIFKTSMLERFADRIKNSNDPVAQRSHKIICGILVKRYYEEARNMNYRTFVK